MGTERAWHGYAQTKREQVQDGNMTKGDGNLDVKKAAS